MNIEVTNPYAVNQDGTREVRVSVYNNTDSVQTAELRFDICDEQHHQVVHLTANEQKEVSQVHGQTGICNVTVTEQKYGDTTQRILDLDTPG